MQTSTTTTTRLRRDPVTVTVTGAAGQIGYAILFRVAAGEMLGPDQPVRLRLLEIPAALPAAEGTAMELTDCAFGLLDSVEITDDPAVAFDGANLALLIGSAPRRPGMDRGDLLSFNAAIFAEQGRAINAAAAEDVRVAVVGNPANTNALIAASHAPDVPLERFTALSRLDHLRAEAQLAEAAGAPVRDVSRVIIWGNHSGTQVPDLDHARIGGRGAREVLAERGLGQEWITETFMPTVAMRGHAIIAARGGSSVASAAHATLRHMRDWVHGTPEGTWTSMCVASDGSYGVEPGVISSAPVICSDGAWQVAPDLEMSADITTRLEASVRELRAERQAVQELGLLGPRIR